MLVFGGVLGLAPSTLLKSLQCQRGPQKTYLKEHHHVSNNGSNCAWINLHIVIQKEYTLLVFMHGVHTCLSNGENKLHLPNMYI